MENLILTVEDNPNDALLLSTAFRKANVSALFEFLTDGQQAIDYFANSAAPRSEVSKKLRPGSARLGAGESPPEAAADCHAHLLQ